MIDRRLVSPAELAERPLRWLWRDRIPLGAITVLDGDPGCGKSTIAYDIAAHVTTGRPMPNCTTATVEPAGVIIIQGEDMAGQSVVPALRAAGADLTKIKLLDRNRFIESPLLLPNDMPIIEHAVNDVQAKLVIIDPFTMFLAGNSNGDAAVRRALGPLAAFAEQHDLAILIVRHLRKSGASNPLYAGLGTSRRPWPMRRNVSSTRPRTDSASLGSVVLIERL
jgi:RecA-family ATPase